MTEPSVTPPIVVDMGKQRRRRIRQLKRGRGRLAQEVGEIVGDVHSNLGDKAKGKEVIPVVVIYTKKRKKRKRRGNVTGFPLFPFPPFIW